MGTLVTYHLLGAVRLDVLNWWMIAEQHLVSHSPCISKATTPFKCQSSSQGYLQWVEDAIYNSKCCRNCHGCVDRCKHQESFALYSTRDFQLQVVETEDSEWLLNNVSNMENAHTL